MIADRRKKVKKRLCENCELSEKKWENKFVASNFPKIIGTGLRKGANQEITLLCFRKENAIIFLNYAHKLLSAHSLKGGFPMTCKEAEQMVTPYIKEELTDKELAAFLEHIEGCKSCYEELEIYYTLYAGLAQLDGENENLDMRNLMRDTIHASKMRVRGRKIFNVYYVFSQVLALLALGVMIIMEIIVK